jgi:DNA polymerase I-like protein with 3'-5' exonuclease and polymerase domains
MLVTRDNIVETLTHLKSKGILALDTETTGLRVHHGDKLFSIIFNDGIESYYFNFNTNDLNYPEHSHTVLGANDLLLLEDLLLQDILFVLANAKFDMHILANAGLPIPKNVYDVLVMARIEDNTHMTYSLDSCAKRIGYEKDDRVSAYIKEFRLYKKEEHNGKMKTMKFFNKVPLPIIQKYEEIDAEITYRLYEHQMRVFLDWLADTCGEKSIFPLIENEKKLTNVCYDIERR